MIKNFLKLTYLAIIVIGFIACQSKSTMITPKKEAKVVTKEKLLKIDTPNLFDSALTEARAEVDAEIKQGVEVPIPKDMSGGYTHERHKRNFFMLQLAGNIYKLTKEEKYAAYIKESLMAYAKMYPTLPLHPTNRSYATGKIFWQCLNDANWLVYVSQAYESIYNYLSKEEREHLETDLFRPFADFLSTGNPQFYNRIHNHSTWGNAAVGMIGLAMKDEELIDRALYGLPIIEGNDLAKDNDGGFIYEKGMAKAGFLAQLDNSFSPDGYFTEGPYYLRYAIFPFLIFSKGLAAKKPELDIMNYRDGIMTKAIYSLLNQTNHNGEFFPLNDALKGMSWKSRELITAVDILYHHDPTNKTLLDIARRQNKVLIDETGLLVSQAIQNGETKPYAQTPMIYTDGKDGTEGGIAVLRKDATCLVLKYSAQGMGHGHFDKLSYSLYDDTGEVIQDYGSARWVNIDQKGGGRYLKENKTFAKQTIAHNTAVLNQTSHYDGKIEKGELHNPYLYFHDFTDPECQVASAIDTNAYIDTRLHRTLFLIDDDKFENPIVLDILKVNSPTPSQIDLPVWYMGHFMKTNFEYDKKLSNIAPIGTKHGYQHIWGEATGMMPSGTAKLTWLNNGKFYTSTIASSDKDKYILGKLGANDPEFNLRNDPVFIQRKSNTEAATFASVIESHGTYDVISEIPLNPYSELDEIKILKSDQAYTIVALTDIKDNSWTVCISNDNADNNASHTTTIGTEKYNWEGPYQLIRKSKSN